MKFHEALALLDQGKKVTRKDWENYSGQDYLERNSNGIEKVSVDKSQYFTDCCDNVDAEATDWEEFKDND